MVVRAKQPGPRQFRREGEYWTIRYEGTVFRLRDAKGLRYIAHLLRRPGERVALADLLAAAETATGEASASSVHVRSGVTKRIRSSIQKIAEVTM